MTSNTNMTIVQVEETLRDFILILVDSLRTAPRISGDDDTCYVMMSDALVNEIADRLEEYVTE